MRTKFGTSIKALKKKREEILGQEVMKLTEYVQNEGASENFDVNDALNFINNSEELKHINEAIKLLTDNNKKR
jgi:hypothetical protein